MSRTGSSDPAGRLRSCRAVRNGQLNTSPRPRFSTVMVLVPGLWIRKPTGVFSSRASVQQTPRASTQAPSQSNGICIGDCRRMFTTK